LKIFQFACAATDITPSVGIHMGGYWGRRSGATHIHDRLMAKALVCGLGEERVVILTVDLVALGADAVRAIRMAVTRDTGIAGAAIMICASHTHAGPLTIPYRGMGEIDKSYLDRVEAALVKLVVTATAKMRPGRLGYARCDVQIGFNRRARRREAAGPVISHAHVLRFESDQGPGATLFQHACHPVVLGGDNHQISGDFVGAAVRYVEQMTGEPALFVNGACGDINPRITGGSFEEVDVLGSQLGQAVLEGVADVDILATPVLSYVQERVDLPLIDPPTRLRAEAEKVVLQLKAKLVHEGNIWVRRVPEARLEWAEAMLALARSGNGRGRSQVFEIQGIGLGKIVLLGLEGEIFARYQLDLEVEWGSVIACGFANGCIGYVPTADEYPLGGYEVDDAYKVYPSVQMIGPASEALIRNRTGALIARLRAGGH